MTSSWFLFLVIVCSCQTKVQCDGWQNKNADIYFMLDDSMSVTPHDFREMLQFVAHLVGHMDIGPDATRVGFGVFSENHHQILAVDNELTKEQVQSQLQKTHKVHEGYTTRTDRALQGILASLSLRVTRKAVPRMGVLITDGASKRHMQDTQNYATLVKEKGIFLFTIGVGHDVKRAKEIFNSIASDPKEDFRHHVDTFDQLKRLQSSFSEIMSKVELLQKDKRASCGTSAVDTVVVFDEATLGANDSRYVKKFIQYLIAKMDIDSGNMRLGVVSKTCTTDNIGLNQNLKRKDFENGELYQSHQGSLARLMRRARQNSFNVINGGRYNVDRRIIIIMDSHIQARELHKQCVTARTDGMDVFVIALETSNNVKDINRLGKSDKHVWVLDSVEDLAVEEIRSGFHRKFCEDL